MPGNGETTYGWRIGALERRADRIDAEKADKRDVDALHNDLKEMKDDVQGLRRTLIQAAITVAGSSVIFAFSTALLIAQ